MDPSIPTSRLRLDYQLYRQLGLLVGVSFPTRPRKEYRFFACPHGSIGSHTSSQRVSFLCMSSQTVRVVCIVRQRYRSLDLLAWLTSFACRRRIFDPPRLRPLHDCSFVVGWVSTYESRGFTPHPCLHSMFSFGGGHCMWVWCRSHSMWWCMIGIGFWRGRGA